MMNRRPVLFIFAIPALFFFCWTTPVSAMRQGKEDMMTHFRYSLSDGEAAPPQVQKTPHDQGRPLPEPEVKALLDRLPALDSEPDPSRDFRLPPQTLPAPKAGRTVDHAFPPPRTEEAPRISAAPLEVVRYSPEGDVPLSPKMSVTFSQPMAALTSHDHLAAQERPVRLTPEPKGQWRWVGTKTLVFQPDDRFPMATRYQADIPAGTLDAAGNRLEKGVSWQFTTPAPRLDRAHPNRGVQGLNPLVFISFDQKIASEIILNHLEVRADNQPVKIRGARRDEIEADSTVNHLVKAARPGRWVAFRPVEPLPPATDITVTIPAQTPSAEGPLKTAQAQAFSFRTYDPFVFEQVTCGWRDQCPPLSPWSVQFNNPIDETAFDPSLVSVSPALPDSDISVENNRIRISGLSKGQTVYKITLDQGLKDIFGQTLNHATTVQVEVGSSPPLLLVPAGGETILDPAGPPVHKIYTMNFERLKIRIYRVSPEDYFQLLDRYRYGPSKADRDKTIGRLVHEETRGLDAAADEMALTEVDLAPYLENGLGHLFIRVEAKPGLFASLFSKRDQGEQEADTWVQATQIGLDAFRDGQEMLVWVNALRDGSPLSGANVRLYPESAGGVSGPDGLARLPLKPKQNPARSIVIAQKGRDLTFLSAEPYPVTWRDQTEITKILKWYVADDRAMYRPGETVHFKGWVRQLDIGKLGDIHGADPGIREIKYAILDPRSNELTSGALTINAFGGFDLAYTLPQEINLGDARLSLRPLDVPPDTNGAEYSHTFQVQEFRRPEFEVKAESSEGPHLIGGTGLATVSARYYSGGPLPSADVNWEIRTHGGHFTPPGWSDYTFGEQRFWFLDFWPGYDSPQPVRTHHGRTDASGKHTLAIDFQEMDTPEPTVVEAEASVMDVNRQEWTAGTNMLVHPADRYVGLQAERYFVKAGQPYPVNVIVTDLDGAPAADCEVVFKAVRRDWKYERGQWKEVEADALERVVKSAAEPVRTVFNFSQGGRWRVTAHIKDSRNRPNQTTLTPWVAGGERPRAKKVEQEEATLIPDRPEYQPGDTAEILIQSPFHPAEGLLSYRCGGLVKVETFHMDESTHTVTVPVEDAYIPNIFLQVDLVGAAPRLGEDGQALSGLPPRPAFASGSLELRVPPLSRTLALNVQPDRKKLEPGVETSVQIQVEDAQGRPVPNSEIALFVVDEAILALTDYQPSDPIGVFYAERYQNVLDSHSRAKINLADYREWIQEAGAGMKYKMSRSPMMDGMLEEGAPLMAMDMAKAMPAPMAAPGEKPRPIAVRKDFNPLAVFAPTVHTDETGKARVTFKMPDNLTRYRVMAVAVAGDQQFGLGESTITARLPLMVRPSPPRFLRMGDRLEFPVVLHNQTDRPLDVNVAIRTVNCRLTKGAGRMVSVPADDRVEVRFPMETVSAGQAIFQVAAGTGSWADASEHRLPVYTPATTEAMAVYGEIDQGGMAQPMVRPPDAFTQFGGLDITTSSTALQALTDAVIYLVSYPFDCSEQVASRVIAVAALKETLPAFNAAGMPSPEKLQAAMTRDIERLQNMQNSNGGFPIWERDRPSWPYHSVHAMHALFRARQGGYAVSDKTINRGLEYLRRMDRFFPEEYTSELRHTLEAYALYVRFLFGEKVTPEARTLIEKAGLDKLSLTDLGWLLYAVGQDPASREDSAAIRRALGNRVEETASTAHFVTSYGEKSYLILNSSRRTDAVILDALIKVDSENSLIPKIVRGLMAHRKQGAWDNTQENAFILLALKDYFEKYEARDPDFVARVWLGERYAGQAEFRGRSADDQRIRIPMAYLAAENPGMIILDKEGPGRLYYRLGLSYAPKNLEIKPADHGFAVERTYDAVDDPGDVRRDDTGAWRVKAGARVKVTITMAAPSRRYHVALMDPLPAGFEPLNPALAVTGRLPEDDTKPGRFWWWWQPWYEHQNLRDHRAEAFASLVRGDVYTYTYYARATTPGRFIAGPAKAEEMYAPETFGRSGTEVVVVE